MKQGQLCIVIWESIKQLIIRYMHKRDIQLMDDPEANSKLSFAILLAYGIVITGFLAIVGIIYGFSQMIEKLNL